MTKRGAWIATAIAGMAIVVVVTAWTLVDNGLLDTMASLIE